jgi:hypothetical protein
MFLLLKILFLQLRIFFLLLKNYFLFLNLNLSFNCFWFFLINHWAYFFILGVWNHLAYFFFFVHTDLFSWKIFYVIEIDVFKKLLKVLSFSFYFLNELLSMWPCLCRTSCLHILLYWSPISTIENKCLDKANMFRPCPSSLLCHSVFTIYSFSLLFFDHLNDPLFDRKIFLRISVWNLLISINMVV